VTGGGKEGLAKSGVVGIVRACNSVMCEAYSVPGRSLAAQAVIKSIYQSRMHYQVCFIGNSTTIR
jgi:hypothetical protein